MRLTAIKTGQSFENGCRSKFIGTRKNNVRRKNNPVTNGTYGKYFIRRLSRELQFSFSSSCLVRRTRFSHV